MKRREFLTLLGGTASTWPLAASAQQSKMPVIGFFHTASPDRYEPQVRAFRLALKEAGYVEGRNIAIEYRWGEGRVERLPALAEDLVGRFLGSNHMPTKFGPSGCSCEMPVNEEAIMAVDMIGFMESIV